jgi:hypothetical protein
MKLEIRGFVLTGFDAPKLQQFIALKNNLLPRKVLHKSTVAKK